MDAGAYVVRWEEAAPNGYFMPGSRFCVAGYLESIPGRL